MQARVMRVHICTHAEAREWDRKPTHYACAQAGMHTPARSNPEILRIRTYNLPCYAHTNSQTCVLKSFHFDRAILEGEARARYVHSTALSHYVFSGFTCLFMQASPVQIRFINEFERHECAGARRAQPHILNLLESFYAARVDFKIPAPAGKCGSSVALCYKI